MNGIFITDASAVFADKLTPDDTIIKGKKFYFGKLEKDFEPIDNPEYNLRCNRILKYLVDKLDLSGFDKSETGIVIGTTNSGIQEFETSANKHHAELGNPAEFLKWYLGTTNYAASVSTACTSGIKAFSTAIKLLENDICKAVIAGGVDTLASMPSYGFHALEVLSHEKTNPFSKNRNGISLGEGGALFVLTKYRVGLVKPTYSKKPSTSQLLNPSTIIISGIGETSDAYHSATPDPKGVQASLAIQQALDDAELKPEDIDYINLHGTGTISNDLMEANAIYKIFKDKVPASSTKPFTGHCLGAAAAIETFICCEILKGNIDMPVHIFDGEYDETLPKINLVTKTIPKKEIKTCLCTSFGFGGTNAAIIIQRAERQEGRQLSEDRKISYLHVTNSSPQSNQLDCRVTDVPRNDKYCHSEGNINLMPEESPENYKDPSDSKNCCPQDDTNVLTNAAQHETVANILPHDPPMVLIDELLEINLEKQFVKTSVTIHENKIFFDRSINGISPLVGIEFMAQTIGCYAYYKGGQKIPKIGFLLGTRLYENSLEKFENGKTYTIVAKEVYDDNELVSFECLIYNEGEEALKAVVNVFQPKDTEKYIRELNE